jgi:hypothetical protein
MTTTENTINPADTPKIEKSNTLGIGKIEGKEVFITGYQHNVGKPTQYTPKEDVNEDGLTDYYTISTEASFDLDFKEEGVIPINNFFIRKAQAQQIERIPKYAEVLANGGRIGPVKARKRSSTKNAGQTYWCFAFDNEDDYA